MLVEYLIDVLLGPVGLLLNAGELQSVLQEGGNLLSLVTSGQIQQAIDAVLSGQYATSGKIVANLAGTLLWIAVIGALAGGLEGLGEAGELLEIFG